MSRLTRVFLQGWTGKGYCIQRTKRFIWQSTLPPNASPPLSMWLCALSGHCHQLLHHHDRHLLPYLRKSWEPLHLRCDLHLRRPRRHNRRLRLCPLRMRHSLGNCRHHRHMNHHCSRQWSVWPMYRWQTESEEKIMRRERFGCWWGLYRHPGTQKRSKVHCLTDGVCGGWQRSLDRRGWLQQMCHCLQCALFYITIKMAVLQWFPSEWSPLSCRPCCIGFAQ